MILRATVLGDVGEGPRLLVLQHLARQDAHLAHGRPASILPMS